MWVWMVVRLCKWNPNPWSIHQQDSFNPNSTPPTLTHISHYTRPNTDPNPSIAYGVIFLTSLFLCNCNHKNVFEHMVVNQCQECTARKQTFGGVIWNHVTQAQTKTQYPVQQIQSSKVRSHSSLDWWSRSDNPSNQVSSGYGSRSRIHSKSQSFCPSL